MTRLLLPPKGRRNFLTALFLVLLPAVLAGQPLTPIATYTDGVDGIDGLAGNRWVEASPDGRHVYVAGQGDNAVALFERHAGTGELTPIEVYIDGADGIDGIGGVSAVEVSPDGRHVYAAATFEATLSVLARSPIDGRLSPIQTLRQGVDVDEGLLFVVWARVSPDGRHVYTTAFFDDTVLVWQREPASGRLSLLQTLTDGVDGEESLNGVFALAVSPGGRHVYAGGFLDSALNVYHRHPVNGELTSVQVLEDGMDGVDGLGLVRDVAFAPGGRQVYTAASGDHTLAVWDRDPSTGQLTARQILTDGFDGVDGLFQATAVRLSADGRRLFVASLGDSAVAVFDRQGKDGRLRFVEAVRVDGPGLDGAIGLALPPGGRHLYVSSTFSSSVAALRVD